MKFFPVFITFSHFGVRTRFYYNVLIKAENMRMCFLLLNCEKKKGMKAKKANTFEVKNYGFGHTGLARPLYQI